MSLYLISLSPSLPPSFPWFLLPPSVFLSHSPLGPPDIVIAPSDTNLPQGQTALFTCVATYRSAPARIAWYREYERVYNDSRITTYTDSFEENGVRFVRSILELCSAEPSDGGGYYCVAYTDGHPYRNSSAHFTIDIIEPEGTCIYNLCMCCVCTCMCKYMYIMRILKNYNSLGCEQPLRPRC